ncbi:uncharacterized protein LOC110441112 isoform X2 [Mizuhopecten yessoensis]|uniref:uncharacterized protein LOC110441112 isoform X2 n=1 Tax=Mizuhopecten yessoensis TaxID=6573 RepID=UPI000B458AB5|nr:uncharacterized protein LOC110441112 isoform X2 [Mizuhopecten yessoensis]
MTQEGIPVKTVDLKEIIHKMAEAQSPPKTDEEKQCLEHIAESNCADILRQVIYCKVGRPQCSLFCRKVSERRRTFTTNQREILSSGNISNFDVALCIQVVRQINGINPNKERWNSKVADDNHTLFGSLQRIALFRKKVIICPEEGEFSFHELFRLISTAFQDIQREMKFERDFHADLDVTCDELLTPVYKRLPSQVEPDAIKEEDEHRGKNDIDEEMDYSCLHRNSSGELRAIDKARISLIEKYKHRFRLELNAPQADVMVVYSENDRDAAEGFRQSIDGRVLSLVNRKQANVKAMLYDKEGLGETKLNALEAAYSNSTYAFLYLTKSFVKNDYTALVAQSLLMESINSKDKKWRVVPFHTSPLENRPYKVPLGINTLKSLNAWNQDRYYWGMMDDLLSGTIHEREDREIKMFDRKYEEAISIQNEDKKHEDSIGKLEKLSLNRTQPQQDRPRSVVQPMPKPDDSVSASCDSCHVTDEED